MPTRELANDDAANKDRTQTTHIGSLPRTPQRIEKKPESGYEIRTVATVLRDNQDRYHDKCPMK
jgi:hypothetical protein